MYECSHCKYYTQHKSALNKHELSKKHIKNKLAYDNENTLLILNKHESKETPSESVDESHTVDELCNSNIKCQFCHKAFKTNSNMNRHIRLNCTAAVLAINTLKNLPAPKSAITIAQDALHAEIMQMKADIEFIKNNPVTVTNTITNDCNFIHEFLQDSENDNDSQQSDSDYYSGSDYESDSESEYGYDSPNPQYDPDNNTYTKTIIFDNHFLINDKNNDIFYPEPPHKYFGKKI